MKKPAILIAEPDESLRRRLGALLVERGFQTLEAADLATTLRIFALKNPVLIILNASLTAPWDGVEAARQMRCQSPGIPVILLTANSSEDLAIAALKAGINDYFKVPCSFEDLALSITRCLSNGPMHRSGVPHTLHAPHPTHLPCLIGESPPMQEIKAYLEKVAPSDSNVLITGETGTGKELVAGLIQKYSLRCHKPFVCINCAAIPDTLLESELFGYERGAFTGADSIKEGKLKLADGGSIFFDEIGDMSPYAQAKILRAIESKEVHRLGGKRSIPLNVRVIAATNQDLERLMLEGTFRKDLYFRLNVARIHLPPLRDRTEDIPLLLDHYLREGNHRFHLAVEGFTGEALEALRRYAWPGNIREVKNLVEAIFVGLPSPRIALRDLPEQWQQRLGATTHLPQSERDRVLSALSSTQWNVSKAAQQLHWSRMTVYRKMRRWQIVKGGETAEGTAMAPPRTTVTSPPVL